MICYQSMPLCAIYWMFTDCGCTHMLWFSQKIKPAHDHRRNPLFPLSITHRGSCKHQLGWMMIIKNDLIGTSWGSMSIFVQSERSFQRTFVSLFKMATMNDLVCKQSGSEIVVMLTFLQKSFVFYTIDLIGQWVKLSTFQTELLFTIMIPHG